MRIVVEHEQTGVYDALAYHRYVVKHVCRLLDTGSRIDIVSEIGSYALKIFQKQLSREILGSVEAHVLEEVSQTVLVRGLLDCAHMRCKIKFRPLGRFVIVLDVISQAIVQLAYTDSLVVRQQHLRMRRKSERRGKNCD